MKITKRQLKRIIKEEIDKLCEEDGCSPEEIRRAREIIAKCSSEDDEATVASSPAGVSSFMAKPVPLEPGQQIGRGEKRIRTIAEDKK